jgi:hypothetical protein
MIRMVMVLGRSDVEILDWLRWAKSVRQDFFRIGCSGLEIPCWIFWEDKYVHQFPEGWLFEGTCLIQRPFFFAKECSKYQFSIEHFFQLVLCSFQTFWGVGSGGVFQHAAQGANTWVNVELTAVYVWNMWCATR